MRRTCMWIVGALVAVSASDAIAQTGSYRGFATGFVGSAGGGDLPRTSVSFGGAASVIESSGWGADMDISFSDDHSGATSLDVAVFMVNANWTKPAGVWRPYVSGGAGAMRLHGCFSGCPQVISTTDFGLNVGGGTYVRINDVVFARGEVKYLWAPGEHPDLSRPDNYGFVRVTVGVSLMWTLVP